MNGTKKITKGQIVDFISDSTQTALNNRLSNINPSYTGLLSGIGETQTGSSATGVVNLSQTWNTTGAPSAFLMNITDTASSTLSRLMDLRVGGVSQFRVDKAGALFLPNGTINMGTSTVLIYTTSANGSAYSASGRTLRLGSNIGNAVNTAGIVIQGVTTISSVSGISNAFTMLDTFSPTSGTAILNALNVEPTINQGAGATGISRGLYVNPVLTSAADFRAIESVNGKVILTDTLTAVGGANAGSLLSLNQTWNTTGSPNAIDLSITNTASTQSSNFLRFRLSGKNAFRFQASTSTLLLGDGSNNTGIGSALATTGAGSIDGTAIRYSSQIGASTGYGFWFTTTSNRTPTSGESGMFNLRETFAPITGTGTHNTIYISPIINQTGDANGITRGLYVNPTLTAAAAFRAIEVTDGKLVFSSTITAPGTTGARIINKISGKVNAAAGSTSLVVTNNLVTTSSIVMCQLGTNDATCIIKSVVEANGSFTINYTAPTSETVIKFFVIN